MIAKVIFWENLWRNMSLFSKWSIAATVQFFFCPSEVALIFVGYSPTAVVVFVWQQVTEERALWRIKNHENWPKLIKISA